MVYGGVVVTVFLVGLLACSAKVIVFLGASGWFLLEAYSFSSIRGCGLAGITYDGDGRCSRLSKNQAVGWWP